MNYIKTLAAPPANGHYSQAIEEAGVIYLSMQLPINPNLGTMADNLEDQARQLFLNCNHILHAAQSSLQSVVSATVYLADINDWGRVNELFADAFGAHKPARGMVCVPSLHLGAKIGIQMIARKDR